MKKFIYSLLFLIIPLAFASAQNLPEKSNPPKLVNDFANMLSTQEQQLLEQKLRAYNDTTSTQIAIVTVPSLDGYDISEYAFALGRKWGIGQKGKNNGVLILVKPKVGNERGQAFIATGYGMEGSITDAQSNRIVNQILIPAFRNNQNYAGLNAASDRIIKLATGEYKNSPKGAVTVSPITSVVVFFIIIAFFGLLSIAARKQRAKYGTTEGYSSQGYHRSSAASSLPWWLLLMGMGSNIGNRGRNSGSWNDFSSGGGFGGGGFGGFGGGDFGGGGAGGSW